MPEVKQRKTISIPKEDFNRFFTYNEFKEDLENGIIINNYYEVIVACAHPILCDIKDISSAQVAKDLGLSATKLSHITMILRAIAPKEV